MERQNAVMHRIWQMRDMWGNAWQNEPSAIIWKIKAEETVFPDSFFVLEESNEYSSFEEYFIRFDTPFVSHKKYSSDLLEHLISMCKETLKYDDGTYLPGADKWQPLNQDWDEKNKALPAYFFENLESLITVTGYPAGKKIVLYLSPLKIDNKSEWNRWVDEAINTTSNTVLMLKEHIEYPTIVLSRKAKEKAEILEPKINLNDIIKQEAKAGNDNDPNVVFRLCIIEMAEAVGVNDINKMEIIGKKAMRIANTLDRTDMAAIVLITMGIHYIAMKKHEKATEKLDQSMGLCNSLIESGNALGLTLAGQAESAIASMLFKQKNYAKAKDHYMQMATYSQRSQNRIYQIEALRMCALCEKQQHHYREAVAIYMDALEIGEIITEAERALTTLPLVKNGLNELGKYIPDNIKSRLKEKDYVG